MKILQIAHVNVPVLSKTGGYGGLEGVVSVLDRAYSDLGHESYVAASTDSEVHGIHVPTIQSLYGLGRGHRKGDVDYLEEGFSEHAVLTLDAIREINPDVIQDHTGYHLNRSFTERVFDPSKGLRTAAEISHEEMPPILATLHGYVTPENLPMYQNFDRVIRGQRVSLNAVSQFQRAAFREIIDVDHVVLNAVDPNSFDFGADGKGYTFSMGSIYRGKGTRIALEASRELGKKMILAGPYFHNISYWKDEIEPLVDQTELDVPTEQMDQLVSDFVNSSKSVLYVGELNAAKKRKIFTGADAFYFPVIIDETFGLVSAEANFSGVPVVTYLSGGVPEVVKHGVSGFTVKRGDKKRFVDAASRVGDLSRSECRAWAEANFRSERQAKDYLQIFEGLNSNT